MRDLREVPARPLLKFETAAFVAGIRGIFVSGRNAFITRVG
jgi:hypothetical protein